MQPSALTRGVRLPSLQVSVVCASGIFQLLWSACWAAAPAIVHDASHRQVTMADAGQNLVLRLNYGIPCRIDRVFVGGRDVIDPGKGVSTGFQVGQEWFRAATDLDEPRVSVTSNLVTVSDIRLGGETAGATETWRFTVQNDAIVWRIDRTYNAAATLEESALPSWHFQDMNTWTGGLLGHGGVAWCKLFDRPGASYGVHNGKVTFWHKEQPRCLRLFAASPSGSRIAARYSRHLDGIFSCDYTVSDQEMLPRYGLSRFRPDRQDIWQPFAVRPGVMSMELTMSAPAYDEAYDRGVFPSLDGGAIREICHTIARIGAIDELIMGSNGYYSGFAVLHEPWLAQLGLPLNEPDYFRAFGETLEFQRQYAIGADGRVKSRWGARPGDEMPGTYDDHGFYECQWGWLMDAQTSWVINVADQFDFSGDHAWLERQKASTEKVLGYILARDLDGDGLVEMMTASHKEARGSDWIDVVWAAHENALVNAQLYFGLRRWSDMEELLHDPAQARRYTEAADKLKHRFNQSTKEGGFWETQQGCYAYWRNQDDTIHGTNWVVPVNFSAIGYGLCDDPERRRSVLDRFESVMQRQQLFFWPLSFYSYAKEEGHPKVNWPFPSYENGDFFLAWGELGTRAYAAYKPEIAVKYIRNVLQRYNQDGLSFQRYLRQTQAGAGDDILANNSSIVVGLYRNIYGLQPKYNRLYLEPHLVPELNGTRLIYQLRGQRYDVELRTNDFAVSVNGFTVHGREPFAVRSDGLVLEYFSGATTNHSLVITTTRSAPLNLNVRTWPLSPSVQRAWSVSSIPAGMTLRQTITGLSPGLNYTVAVGDNPKSVLRSDASGRLDFESKRSDGAPMEFALWQE